MLFGVVEVSLDGWEQRRLVMTDPAGGGLAVDELGIAAAAGRPVRAALTFQPDGHDVSVGVPMLHGWILRHEDGAHGLAC